MFVDPTIADVYRFFICLCGFNKQGSSAGKDSIKIINIDNIYMIENEDALIEFLKVYLK